MPSDANAAETEHHSHGLAAMVVAALGVVYGDLGTSPLYTLQTIVSLAGGTPSHEALIGLLSLVVWALLLTVSIKYVTFVMRIDNDGEGGILALMSLLGMKKKYRPVIVAIGLFGAALIYGDGTITPAISVLSAVEGLKLAAPSIASYIVPISVVILIVLFSVQYNGTARIGWVFGPIMCVWFVVIGLLGIRGIVMHPGVLAALNPWHGIHYLLTGGWKAFEVLGGVFLALTGAEALYADMGHVGARPIQLAWYFLVFPALLLNYAGQTALMMADSKVDNSFYQLCPAELMLPMIILATVATIIASQAIITGAFSMTRQAILLGWCPRLTITQTSAQGYGQIYVGVVNWLLMVVTVALTVFFGSSDKLAAAYGIAVSMTMMLTTCLMFVAMREIWGWGIMLSSIVAGAFMFGDSLFFVANMLKVFEGGWIPLALAACVYTLMFAWHRGSVALVSAIEALTVPIDAFTAQLGLWRVQRVPGTAIFLTKSTDQTPPIVLQHVTHSRSLHENVLALSIRMESVPTIPDERRIEVKALMPNFWRVTVRYGFMEKPDIPLSLIKARTHIVHLDLRDVTYFVGHETVRHRADGTGMPFWQEQLYAFMQRNAAGIGDYFSLPSEHVMEIGRQIEI